MPIEIGLKACSLVRPVHGSAKRFLHYYFFFRDAAYTSLFHFPRNGSSAWLMSASQPSSFSHHNHPFIIGEAQDSLPVWPLHWEIVQIAAHQLSVLGSPALKSDLGRIGQTFSWSTKPIFCRCLSSSAFCLCSRSGANKHPSSQALPDCWGCSEYAPWHKRFRFASFFLVDPPIPLTQFNIFKSFRILWHLTYSLFYTDPLSKLF